MDNSKHTMMTTKPVGELIIKMAAASIVIMLVTALYNLTASYFVSHLGTNAIAAVGVSFPLQAVIQAIGFFFGQGAGNYISRSLGALEHDKAAKMAATGFFSAFFISTLLSISCLLFLNPLVRLLGATDSILPFAVDYLRWIIIAAPFMVSSFMLNNLLRFQGAANLAVIGIVSGVVVNVGLTPLFIFTFDMGMTGAALAGMISQIISSLVLFLIVCYGKDIVRIRFGNFTFKFSVYKNIINGGTPSFLRQGLLSVSTILLNHAAGNYGESVIAALSVVTRIVMIAAAIVLGIGQGYQPVCGFNYGAGLFQRVRSGFWFTVRSTTIFLIIAALAGYIFSPQLISIFGHEDKIVIDVGSHALRFQCLILPFSAFIIVMNMMLQTTGKTVPASILALSRQGLFLIPLLYTLVPLWGVLGIELCTPIADSLTFILTIILGRKALTELKQGGNESHIGFVKKENRKD
ncbi:MAG: MATE family efflux transporter [Bacteroidales bacterium]|jgi:putative MATE family efflux protein|nr:MATE family efflux transporter [Bacteroidales bacterium]